MNALLNAAPRECELLDFSDEELLVEFRNFGSRRCFDELVRRHQASLTRYLFRQIGRRDVAEDVFQAAFLRVLTKSEQFDESQKFRPWLYRIALNQAIDIKRRALRHDETISLDSPVGDRDSSWSDALPGRELDPRSKSEEREIAQNVRSAIAQLPENLRQILELVYFQGMKYYEAAENLHLPSATLKSRLNRALRQLNTFFARQRTELIFARFALDFENCPQA